MCDDDVAHAHSHVVDSGVSRRKMLQGMVALAGLSAALAACGPDQKQVTRALRGPNRAGLNSFIVGMHLHASASEGAGSMRSQLAQAAANGFDVAWFTEHDWRRRRLLFRPTYSFRPEDVAMGGVWLLPPLPTAGSATGDSGGQLVTDQVSPNDRTPGAGSLRLRAVSSGSSKATVGHRVDATSRSRLNYNARIAGRTVSVDVLPTKSGTDGWGEVLFRLSRHPRAGNRPEGVVSLMYRLRPDVPKRRVSSDGTLGIVDVPVTPGRWQKVTFDLTADVAQVWPDIDPRDNSLNDIQFAATSRRQSPVEVFFGFLRFDEHAGYDGLGVEHALLAAYASDVPHVQGLVGTEISLGPHINQFGGPQQPYDYGPETTLREPGGEIRSSIVDFIHSQGGLASINHPFKPGDASLGTSAQAIARDLLTIGAGGADILEVGYGNKGGANLPEHLAVWDALSRNAVFLTGNGVSDDHSGQNWATQVNRFYTAPWARGRDEHSLLDALARGQAYVGYLGSFGGTLDMTVDNIPMGGVAVGGATSRTVRIDATGVPSGGAVQVVRGVVDYAGVGSPDPNTKVLASKSAKDLASKAEVGVDAGEESFVRLQVVDRNGAVVAFGQPTWLLRREPPHGIPKARRV